MNEIVENEKPYYSIAMCNVCLTKINRKASKYYIKIRSLRWLIAVTCAQYDLTDHCTNDGKQNEKCHET